MRRIFFLFFSLMNGNAGKVSDDAGIGGFQSNGVEAIVMNIAGIEHVGADRMNCCGHYQLAQVDHSGECTPFNGGDPRLYGQRTDLTLRTKDDFNVLSGIAE